MKTRLNTEYRPTPTLSFFMTFLDESELPYLQNSWRVYTVSPPPYEQRPITTTTNSISYQNVTEATANIFLDPN